MAWAGMPAAPGLLALNSNSQGGVVLVASGVMHQPLACDRQWSNCLDALCVLFADTWCLLQLYGTAIWDLRGSCQHTGSMVACYVLHSGS